MSRVKRHKLKKSMVKKEQKKSLISKQAIWTIIIGGIMILSVFGIMFSSYNSGEEDVIYGDYTFKLKRTTGRVFWAVDIDGKQAEFNFLPSDLEEISVDREVVDKLLSSRVLYITFNPNTESVERFELTRFELASQLDSMFMTYSMPGITEEDELYNQPIVDCGNATATTPVILLREGNETSADVEGDCIIINTDEYSALAMKDRVVYGMLDILE